MPDTGQDLGLDLAELYRAGSVYLPKVADEFAAAAAATRSVSIGTDRTFVRDELFGGKRGPAYQAWEDLRADLEKFLNDTNNNLRDAGRALVLAANTYASTDDAAKKELDRLKTEWELP
jgi:hypothetical protein